MILVDTSVWVDHLRNGDEFLAQLLGSGEVITHPFIIGELACGYLNNRINVRSLLENLPKSSEASNQEALYLIENNELMGTGIGYIDVHLLAATRLNPSTVLWTHDKHLKKAANMLSVGFIPA